MIFNLFRRFTQGALVGALFLCSGVAAGAGIAVNPVRLELEPGQRTASITVTNDTDATKVLETSVLRWTQVNGESVYAPDTGIIATPVLFRVPPKGTQLVRVGFAAALPEITAERSYRVYLTEVPEDKGAENQVRFLLRMGIPLFFPPAQPQDALVWQVQRQPDGTVAVTAENRGNRHVRVQKLQLESAGRVVAELQDLKYVLAGAQGDWRLKPDSALPASAALHVKAHTGRGMLESGVASSAAD